MIASYWSKRRAQDVRHDRQVRQQGQEAVHVAPHLHRAVLRQRPHDRRPEQPEFGGEEVGPEEFVDAPPVQHRLGRQREPHEIKPVAHAQAEMRAVHDAAVAVDDVRPVMEWVAFIEGEELVLDGNRRIACRGDGREQVERAAELRIKDGAGRQDVAGRRTAGQRERAAQPLTRLVDRDVLAGHPRVADEIRGGCQSAEAATDDMRLHLLSSPLHGVGVLRSG